jgi:FkbM family methyltransferase
MRDFYAQIIKPDSVCFDVGANVGDRAEIFLELGARVVALEPQASCVRVLKRRFSGNDRLTIVEEAVGASEGTAELHICSCNNGISTLSQDWMTRGRHAGEYKWDRTTSVRVTTLDSLVERYGRPDFCKIDVEGFEVSVLNGLSTAIPCLSLEFHPELIAELRKCLDIVSRIVPTEFNYTLYDGATLASSDWLTGDALYNSLSAIDRPDLWGDVYARPLALKDIPA